MDIRPRDCKPNKISSLHMTSRPRIRRYEGGGCPDLDSSTASAAAGYRLAARRRCFDAVPPPARGLQQIGIVAIVLDLHALSPTIPQQRELSSTKHPDDVTLGLDYSTLLAISCSEKLQIQRIQQSASTVVTSAPTTAFLARSDHALEQPEQYPSVTFLEQTVGIVFCKLGSTLTVASIPERLAGDPQIIFGTHSYFLSQLSMDNLILYNN